MDARRLVCPHCQGPVQANPIFRWYQRFQCPHCGKLLQFDARTNLLGMVGSALFVAMASSMVMGTASWTPWFAGITALLWLVLIFLSYLLRGIVKG